jgi:hypothetical protein
LGTGQKKGKSEGAQHVAEEGMTLLYLDLLATITGGTWTRTIMESSLNLLHRVINPFTWYILLLLLLLLI